MQNGSTPVVKDLVLIGGGHSHVTVLKQFGMRPLPGVRLTLICRDVHTPYSGMLPGFVAGHYGYDDIHIDLGPLARFAGARLYHEEVTGLDPANRRIQCRSRPDVSYDVLSINTGSTPDFSQVPGADDFVVPVKPINNFLSRWQRLVPRVMAALGVARIGVVGAGAGGVELTLAMQCRLQQLCHEVGLEPKLTFHLFSRTASILPTHNGRVQATFRRLLAKRGVNVHAPCRVTQLWENGLGCEDGTTHELEEILWVTNAAAPSWPEKAGLAVDANGFIQVNDCLQSVSHPDVFAAGDVAAVQTHPREKAGVFAVRQGPPLSRNLRRALLGQPPQPYRPQKHWLSLISTGDKYAIASRGRLFLRGRLIWRWKDWIDRRFMDKFNVLPSMESAPTANLAAGLADTEAMREISAMAMRCGGCGAKVGANTLDRALGQLQPLQRSDVVVGLNHPDDAAVVEVPPQKVMVHTVDFFRALVDDPYIFGKIAAQHSLGDIFAMGADGQTALAIATVPYGLEHKTEDTLSQMLRGAEEVLQEADVALVGGHTSEGAELSLGFAINGLVRRSSLLRKTGMQPGDGLILTKPLGTGTLFAAEMRLKAKGRWVSNAVASMLVSNRAAAACLRQHGATACTDVTGFGLLGHLVEMTRASHVAASLDLSRLPVLEGAEETVAAGIFSTLQPQNVRLRRAIRNLDAAADAPRYPLLFDPQTAGGLLASVPAAAAEACLARLQDLGYKHAALIGGVEEASDVLEPIALMV